MPGLLVSLVLAVVAVLVIWKGSEHFERATERLSKHYGLPIAVHGPSSSPSESRGSFAPPFHCGPSLIGSCVILYRWVIRTVSLWLPSPPTSGTLPKMVTHDPMRLSEACEPPRPARATAVAEGGLPRFATRFFTTSMGFTRVLAAFVRSTGNSSNRYDRSPSEAGVHRCRERRAV